MPSADFTLAAYRDLLTAAKRAGYAFASFADIGKEQSALACLLRHDVDAELLQCAAICDVERQLGIRATYFVMTRASNYNLFSIEGRRAVAMLMEAGHDIGLHFMGELYHDREPAALISGIREEARWLEGEFGRPIRAVSFHQPTKAVLRGEIVVDSMVNTYNRGQMGQYFYVSDTNMQWKHEHPRTIFEHRLHARVQLLIHPIWWTAQDMPLERKWHEALRGHDDAVIAHWEERERTLATPESRRRLRSLAKPEK